MFYVLIPVVIFTLDLFLKRYIENNKETGCEEEIMGGKILLRKSHNTGAMLNFLEKKQQLVAGFSLGLSVVIVIGYLFLLGRKGLHLLKLGLSFVVGGALSNVYDRLVRKYVVDYFSFNVKWERFRDLVFNISDIFIFIGSFFVILWNGKQKS